MTASNVNVEEKNRTNNTASSNNVELSTGSSNYQTTVTQESFNKLQSEVNELKEITKSFEKSRFDLMTVLSVFVGLITYLGLEIQVFKEISNPLLTIGVSIFFIASILLFVLTINIILKNSDNISWEILYKNPLYVILVVLFISSIVCIVLGYHDFLMKERFSSEILVKYT